MLPGSGVQRFRSVVMMGRLLMASVASGCLKTTQGSRHDAAMSLQIEVPYPVTASCSTCRAWSMARGASRPDALRRQRCGGAVKDAGGTAERRERSDRP